MPATVFTLAETTDRTGYVVAVFRDREMAIDAARSHALHRAQRCRQQDARTFGLSADHPNEYEVMVRVIGEITDVVVVHIPSGEDDAVSWHIRAFDVVERTGAEAVQSARCPITA